MLPPLLRILSVTALGVTRSAAVIVAGASGGGNTASNTTSAQFASEYGFAAPVIDNVIAYSDASGVYLGYNPATATRRLTRPARNLPASTALPRR